MKDPTETQLDKEFQEWMNGGMPRIAYQYNRLRMAHENSIRTAVRTGDNDVWDSYVEREGRN